MEKNLMFMGVGIAMVCIFATAALSSALTLTALGSMINSGAVEEKLVAGFQEEMAGMTVDCNSSYVENSAVINMNGEKLYCTMSQG